MLKLEVRIKIIYAEESIGRDQIRFCNPLQNSMQNGKLDQFRSLFVIIARHKTMGCRQPTSSSPLLPSAVPIQQVTRFLHLVETWYTNIYHKRIDLRFLVNFHFHFSLFQFTRSANVFHIEYNSGAAKSTPSFT